MSTNLPALAGVSSAVNLCSVAPLSSRSRPRRVTASWCQRIFPLSLALPPRSTSAAQHHYHHGTNHRHRVAKEVRSQAPCSRTAYTSAYTFAVGSDHPPPLSPHNQTMQMFLESSFSFCTQQVTTRLHSGEAASAGEGGVNRTVARKSGQAAPAGGHHGGPRGTTPSSQPGYPRALTGCGLWLSGWGRGAKPLPGGCSVLVHTQINVSTPEEVYFLVQQQQPKKGNAEQQRGGSWH
jgi:hypothetical protein